MEGQEADWQRSHVEHVLQYMAKLQEEHVAYWQSFLDMDMKHAASRTPLETPRHMEELL